MKTISLNETETRTLKGIKVGDKCGHYLVIADLGTRPISKAIDKRVNKEIIVTTRFYLCRCKCGVEREIPRGNLTSGRSKGCAKCRTVKKRGRNPNCKTYHPHYARYSNMLQRCYNPKNKLYYGYGGRGITVCERWRNSFELYAKDIGECPAKGMSVDRIDKDGNYEPNNVRWATIQQQNSNRRPRTSKLK